MKNLMVILSALPLVAFMFLGCEKETVKEVIVHDTAYIEFDQFSYTSTGVDSLGDMIIFSEPNYPNIERFELYLNDWNYFNDLKVDEWVFWAVCTGNSISFAINGEQLSQSFAFTDDFGDEWQYLEFSYNTTKKSDRDINRLIDLYKAEMKKR